MSLTRQDIQVCLYVFKKAQGSIEVENMKVVGETYGKLNEIDNLLTQQNNQKNENTPQPPQQQPVQRPGPMSIIDEDEKNDSNELRKLR